MIKKYNFSSILNVNFLALLSKFMYASHYKNQTFKIVIIFQQNNNMIIEVLIDLITQSNKMVYSMIQLNPLSSSSVFN
jgi:hypothetical protein